MAIAPEELFSLAVYFVLMLGIGAYAYIHSTRDVSGYMLGGRRLHPAVGALSAGASDMSGWMLLGLPGAVYVSGLGAAWIAVGLTIGAYFNYRCVAPRLRSYTELADDAITIPDYFEKRFQDNTRLLRLLSSVVIVVFFTLYTSAGLVAGGKLFESAFGLDYSLGLWVTAGVVLSYTMMGGFLAVSLTDFVQGTIMFFALVLVPFAAIWGLGGFEAVTAFIQSASPAPNGGSEVGPPRSGFFDWFQNMSALGFLSLMAWGLGYFGQPHIIVRFMAIRSLKDMAVARLIGMAWMVVTLLGAILTGVAGVAYVAAKGLQADFGDPETIFILLSQTLFHPLVSGFLLAAILAAIMSTISSQLLVSSSSLTEDFYKAFVRRSAGEGERLVVGRMSVLGVALVALVLASDRSSNILTLVSNAWAGFGAAFGPVILFSLYWPRTTRNGALSGVLVGALTVLVWLYAPFKIGDESLSGVIYEMIPGFALGSLATVIVSLVDRPPPPQVASTFRLMHQAVRAEDRSFL